MATRAKKAKRQRRPSSTPAAEAKTKPRARAKTKTPPPAVEGPYEVVGPRIDDGVLHLSPLDLSRFDLLQHKVANALQGAKLKELELAEVRRKSIAKITGLELEHQELERLAVDERKELQKFRAGLEGAYKVDFSTVTYDDVTGRIFAAGEPVCRS